MAKEGNVIGSFLLGALLGGAAVWLYGREIRELLDDKTRVARSRLAESLHAAAEGLEAARDRIEGADRESAQR